MEGDSGRRRSSSSSIDKQKLARLQQLKVFQQGGLGSKIFKVKALQFGDEESAASALSKVMTRKKGAGEVLQLQVEIDSETHWRLLMRREGLVVVEVYAGWVGPCVSMSSLLKKVKVDMNDDRLTLALANSDNISDLKIFKNQSEPAWVFYGGGKPVRLMRGANGAKIVEAIKTEFAKELLCLEGKAKRTLISLGDEAERRKTAENEALRLSLEDKLRNAAGALPSSAAKEEVPIVKDEEEIIMQEDEVEEPKDIDVDLEFVIKDQNFSGPDWNLTLEIALQRYSIIALQNFILETGAVTEIKDFLREDFRIVQERYIVLEEDGVRKLFGIPHHLEIPVVEEEEVKKDEEEGVVTEGDANTDEVGQNETSQLQKPPGEDFPSRPSSRADRPKDEISEGDNNNNEDQQQGSEELDGDGNLPDGPKAPKVVVIPVPLPDELVGDTLLFLLESRELQKLLEEQKTQEAPSEESQETKNQQKLPMTADDFLRKRVGPVDFKEAKESFPDSLHGIYGREEWAAGVWCPQHYDEKRYVFLNFFPQFVTEMLLPPPKETPKYRVAIFPALFALEISEHPQLLNNSKDIVAQGKVNVPPKLLERMLKSKGLSPQHIEQQKKSLVGFDMFAVSVNEKNPNMVPILTSLEPIHLSIDNFNGMYETAKLFPDLGVLIDEDSSDDEDEQIFRELMIEKFLPSRSSKLKLEAILDEDSVGGTSNGDELSQDA